MPLPSAPNWVPVCGRTARAISLGDSILVTRPEPGASRTAARLTALGLHPIMAPVLRIEPVPASLPAAERVAAVLATSGNAVDLLPASYRGCRLLTVGNATAARARVAGFRQVFSADGDAVAAARLFCRAPCCLPRGRAVTATGTSRNRAARRHGAGGAVLLGRDRRTI